MMPFGVLRTFGLALFSWFVLGLGIYLAYQSYNRLNEPAIYVGANSTAVINDDPAVADQTLNADELNGDEGPSTDVRRVDVARVADPIDSQSVDRMLWAMVAGAIACLSISFGGKSIANFVLGNSEGKPFVPMLPSSTFAVDRPDGSKLHVNVFGKTDGPTLILTHGWSLNSSAWNYVTRDLAQHFRIVTWDLPGLGLSSAPTRGGFSMEMLAENLEAVLVCSSSNAPAILVGHSIGGMTQQTFCRLFPQHLGKSVIGMVLLHTTYTNPVQTNFVAALTKAIEVPILIPLNYLMIALSPLAWLSNWQSYWNGSSHWTTRFTSFTGRQSHAQLDHSAQMGAAAWPATVARGNLAMLRFDASATLPDIRIPVLVIGGEEDRMTVCAASDHICQLLPNERSVRIPGGHLGFWEYSDEVVHAIQQFATAQFRKSKHLDSTLISNEFGCLPKVVD